MMKKMQTRRRMMKVLYLILMLNYLVLNYNDVNFDLLLNNHVDVDYDDVVVVIEVAVVVVAVEDSH
jgi:hypothetical protein